MVDNFVEGCKTQLMIDATTVRNIMNVKKDKSVSVKKFATSSTNCAKVGVPGTKDVSWTFDVALSEEEDIEDLIDVGDEVNITRKLYLPDGTLYRTEVQPVIIEKMSDEANIDEGGLVMVNVSATSNGTEVIT